MGRALTAGFSLLLALGNCDWENKLVVQDPEFQVMLALF